MSPVGFGLCYGRKGFCALLYDLFHVTCLWMVVFLFLLYKQTNKPKMSSASCIPDFFVLKKFLLSKLTYPMW